MGIPLPSRSKEVAGFTESRPPAEGAYCFQVVFFCSERGASVLSDGRSWASDPQFYPADATAFEMPDYVRALHEKDCTAGVHHVDYEVTMVKSE